MARAGRRIGAGGGRRATTPFGLAIRLALFVLLLWLAGFAVFLFSLPGAAADGIETDGVVVLTGGPQRLDRGVDVLRQGLARRLLVSGVDHSVKPAELRAVAGIPPALFRCCIDLGFEARTTRSNAEEVAAWVGRNRFRSLRLVTAGYHMPRARLELAARLPQGVVIIEDGVGAGLPLRAMLSEYAKFEAAWLRLRVQPL